MSDVIESVADQHAAPTAGPWHVTARHGEHAVDVVDRYDELVAFTGDLLKPWAECEANARAIATLPDLIALAREMVDVIEGHPSRNPFALVDDCRAALARINGERP